ncbi:hypothetical protein FE257_011771 [Aspergillus nanangensis]|uniref:Major facilitator superfamily (MFS) profile domain-containing protein n=1 Tax=Aspergillus nanangensis TaxID=2582783 RepID=A0AAD4GX12_ASPNN|nr:hypothetical protein FE257_011771 [Aspergillus nanangensis]
MGAASEVSEVREQGSDMIEDEFNRFSHHRKVIMVVVMAWSGLLSPISSTSVLSAIPNVAETYNTTGSVIGISNALYMVFMALSPCFWGPWCQVLGRRMSCLATSVTFLGASIGTALSPNLASFMIFRMLSAFSGTAILVIGPAVIRDLYQPLERATALAYFYTGTLVGPTIGPLLAGVIVTYTTWRVIFWMQTGLSVVSLVAIYFLLAETQSPDAPRPLSGLSRSQQLVTFFAATNPWRIIRPFESPSLVIAAVASGSLVWNQYSLLTPIRYVLNPKYHLETPLQSGLLYLAPGVGYMLGTLGGGRWADYTARKWYEKRGKVFVAEDRLYAAVPFQMVVLPACMLIYGWSVEKTLGGIAVPIVFMFLQGVAQLFCYPSLNTYCLDVKPDQSAELIAGNFFIRYIFGAVASAAAIPATEVIGVGFFSTIAAALLAVGGGGLLVVARWGTIWRKTTS